MGGPPRFTVTTRTRRVVVEASPGGPVRVEGGEARPQPDGSIEIRGEAGGSRITLHCPAGSDISVGTRTGPVETHGSLGDVRVVTETGKIQIDQAQHVDVRTRSGSVRVETCSGECRLVTVSARLEVGTAESVTITSQSGKVAAEEIGGGQVRTISGHVQLGLTGRSRVPLALRVMSTSGTVEITVPADASPAARLRSMSGRIRSAVPPDADGSGGSIEVQTTSGSIRVDHR